MPQLTCSQSRSPVHEMYQELQCLLWTIHRLGFLETGNSLGIASASLLTCFCQCADVNTLQQDDRPLCSEIVSFKSLSAGTQEPRAANCLSLLATSYAALSWRITHMSACNISPGAWAQCVPTAKNTLLLTLMNDYGRALIQHCLSCTASLSWNTIKSPLPSSTILSNLHPDKNSFSVSSI